MKPRFHPEALVEFQEAASHYQRQQRGLGERFTHAVESALSRIGEMPQAGRIIDGDVRRQLTRVFPYAVLYTLEPDYILIVAVMHNHREPGYWRKRV